MPSDPSREQKGGPQSPGAVYKSNLAGRGPKGVELVGQQPTCSIRGAEGEKAFVVERRLLSAGRCGSHELSLEPPEVNGARSCRNVLQRSSGATRACWSFRVPRVCDRCRDRVSWWRRVFGVAGVILWEELCSGPQLVPVTGRPACHFRPKAVPCVGAHCSSSVLCRRERRIAFWPAGLLALWKRRTG